MRGVCAISLDKDKAFVSFASLKGSCLTFLEELDIPIVGFNNDITPFLKNNLEAINQKIIGMETKHSCRCEKIFLELPWAEVKEKRVEDIVTLKSRKKITSSDISRAKKQLEDKFLNWDDFCVHNIIINYEIEGSNYIEPPLGVWAKKIKLKALLIWIKDKMYKEIEDIFDSADRNLTGVIAPQISRLSSTFTDKEKAQVVISIDYDQSNFIARSGDNFFFGKKFDFSFQKAIEELAHRFALKISLAEEIFRRYISFKEIPYFKEITVKRDSGYINLSTQTLNLFIKNYIKSEICYILQEVREDISKDDFVLSFVGRLNSKEGFYGSLQSYVPYSLKAPLQRSIVSSSYGCLRYGISRFLEQDHKKNEPMFRRILNIYREYF